MSLDISAPGIETFVIKGIEDKITKYFGVTKTQFVSSSDRISRMAVLTQNRDIKFPIAFLIFSNGELDSTYSPRSLRRNGVLTDFSEDGKQMGKLYTVPTLMTFSVVLITDSFDNVLRFFKLWMLAATAGSLSFDVTYDNAQIQIGVVPSGSLSIPSRDVGLEAPSFFEFEGSIAVHGFVSPDHIEQVSVLTSAPTVTMR